MHVLAYLPLFAFLFLGFTLAEAANILKIKGGEVLPGETITVELSVDNTMPFVAFQADIPMDAALSYVEGTAALNAARANGHSFSVQVVSGNILKVFAFSMSNTSFSGSSGAVMTLQLLATDEPGNIPLDLENAIIANTTSGNIIDGVESGLVRILDQNDPEPVPVPLANWSVVFMGLMVVVFFLSYKK